MRAFIALDLPDGFAFEVACLARELARGVEGRFLAQESYHLTLAFLGDIDEGQSRGAVAAIDAACDGAPAVPLSCAGLGKFGPSRDATLWLGIGDSPELEALAGRLRDGLSARDVAFDAKPFKPHVTLARRARLAKGDLPALPFPSDDAAPSVTLYRSDLLAEGARYKPLYTVHLSS